MNYEQAMAFLEDTKKYGSQLGLSSITNLMHELGDIQDAIPVVHIAGTNGKGSVGAMLSSVFVESGYKTGRFNTPDVFSYEEEFLMNGSPIEKGVLAELFSKVSFACEKLVKRGLPHPTRFEVETAAAFLWFDEEQCDLAIVEVGMGGETDATNLIKAPVLSILTAISMDHMQFLGNSLAEIARVKAGIIKPGCPVTSMCQEEDVLTVISGKCRELDSELIISDDTRVSDIKSTPEELSFLWKWRDSNGELTRIYLGVHGRYQVENAVCTLTALEVLEKKFPHITHASVINGLRNVRWPGRFEQIHARPYIYLDGAHNEDAVKKLRATLDAVFPKNRILYIMGVLADKEYDKMIPIMFHSADSAPKYRVFTVTPPNPRALDSNQLAQILSEHNVDAVACENIKDAVSCVLKEASDDDVILVFGSLYYLKEARKTFFDQIKVRNETAQYGFADKMAYVDRLLKHPYYLQILNNIERCEANRIYCHHDLTHALDVCRIAWILYLEQHINASVSLIQMKERLYVTGLLHDVGRAVQYLTGEHHTIAGARIANELLDEIGYPEDWKSETLQIISEHSGREDKEIDENRLSYYIEQADHLSRNCFFCKAWESCKWAEHEKNPTILF